jgi:aminodeoxyfutalosine synthase
METIDVLTEADARELLGAPDLIALGMRADDMRRQLHGARTTFVRVFEIRVDAPLGALPARTNAGELRIAGRPETVGAAVAATRATSTLAQGTPVIGFALADLQDLASGAGRSLRDVCAELRHAGLEGIAEVAVDTAIASHDADAGADVLVRAVGDARHAGLLVQRLVVSSLPADRRVAIALAARRLHHAAAGFKAFAPHPRTVAAGEPTTGYDDVKMIALARLTAGIESIQVDWPLYGPKLAQVALTMGADDVDGVAAYEPGLLGTRRSALEEIRGNIRSAALDAVERNGRFEVIGA